MALLKAFVCQVVLFGLYKLFLEQVVVDHLVPDELTRNCLVGFVILLCFGIQLYTEKVEEQAAASKAKSRRRTPPDTAEGVSEFLDARTAHMMRTLDAAMQQMNQMPVSDGYVQNVIFAAAGPEAAVIEHTFSKQPGGVVIEEIYTTKLDDVIYANDEKSNVSANEPIVVALKVEEVTEEKRSDKTESEEEEEEEEEVEELETKSDVCEEEEEDVVTVIDASKPKPVPIAAESEEEEEEEEDEEEEKESSTADNKKNVKAEEKPVVKQSKVEEEEEIEAKKVTGKVTKTS